MRIVSLSPSTTEILYALGVGDHVVGVTVFCDYPSEAQAVAKVGGWSNTDLQKVYALQPDLVLTSTIVQADAAERFNGRPFQHHHSDPRSYQNIIDSVTEIGALVGAQTVAQQLAEEMQTAVSQLKQSAGSNLRVYCEEWPKPPMVSGNWVPDLVRLAGGQYGLLADGEPSRVVTDQEIQDYNPELIILNYCGFGASVDPKTVLKRPGWEKVEAVRRNQVSVIDDTYLNRPGPRIIEGLKRLAGLINHVQDNSH
jgi:iron complex transport system substrate-binding protein